MLVYGDQVETIDPAEILRKLGANAGRWCSHDELRDAFIALSGVAQGVADADFEQAKIDRFRPVEEALLRNLLTSARSLLKSWDAGCSGLEFPSLATVPDLPASVTVKVAEGYAHYALYPEAYALAARELKLCAPPRVVGLRSIGTGLACMVAAALDAPVPVTLRPVGDPFARKLSLSDQLARELLEGESHYVVVDEGPGLSGSSFGCMADWLEDHGVSSERIAFLPGHSGNLGAEASERHRRRWSAVQRPVRAVTNVRHWAEQVLGPIDRWDDISAGRWRPRSSASEADWPAINPQWERAKFLARAADGWWQVRFAGISETGQSKLRIAQDLASGFGPEVAGLTHGWLIQRWHEHAVPTRPTMSELTDYLRLRQSYPVAQGASLAELATMVRRNGPGWQDWDPPIERLQERVRAVRTDGKLDRHEWLRLPTGRLLKADALDHHQGHDLVGCQDLAWDVAGAAIEFDLGAVEASQLEQALGVDPELVAFYRIAYAAFRFGAHRMSESMVDAVEAARHRTAARRYELALVDAVEYAGDVDQALGRGIKALP